jgi:DNA-binding NtrC family response regulator
MAKRLEATPRVLVIDDEPDLLTLMRLTLTKLGLEVVTAESYAEGIAALERGTYALCLTDMQLGDGTGIEILGAIQSKGLDLPCAVITAFGNTDNAVATWRNRCRLINCARWLNPPSRCLKRNQRKSRALPDKAIAVAAC